MIAGWVWNIQLFYFLLKWIHLLSLSLSLPLSLSYLVSQHFITKIASFNNKANLQRFSINFLWNLPTLKSIKEISYKWFMQKAGLFLKDSFLGIRLKHSSLQSSSKTNWYCITKGHGIRYFCKIHFAYKCFIFLNVTNRPVRKVLF